MTTVQTIPAKNDLPWYKFKIALSGIIYTCRFRFNTRMNRWMIDLCDSAENEIINGLPLLISRNITGQFVIAGLPTGVIFVTDDTGQDQQPTRYSFNQDKTLFYVDLNA